MPPKRAVVFANGEYHTDQARRIKATNQDFLVCVDGGVRHCLDEALTPQLLVGDLDSLDEASVATVKKLGTACIQYPAEKDASDLELTLRTLEERSLDEVIVLGASGGRTDHHLFNWQLFGSKDWSFLLRIVDDSVDAVIVSAMRAMDVAATNGQIFSVVPIATKATGVSVKGAQYPLDNASLSPGSTVGLSNVVTEPRLQVSVETGIVLVMLVHTDSDTTST